MLTLGQNVALAVLPMPAAVDDIATLAAQPSLPWRDVSPKMIGLVVLAPILWMWRVAEATGNYPIRS